MKKKHTDTDNEQYAAPDLADESLPFLQDMSELRNAHEHLASELAESRELLHATNCRYAHILDFAPVGYCMIGGDGKIIRANLTLASLLQSDRGTLESGAFSDLVEQDRREEFLRFCKEVACSDGRQWVEARLRKSDGTLLPARIDAILMYDLEQKADVMHATVVDLSEQKRAACELLEVQKIGRVTSFRWDLGSGQLTWSPEFYSIVERSADEVPATFGGCLSLVHPDDRQLVMDAANTAFSGAGEQLIEFRVVVPDGREKWVAMQGRVQYAAEGGRALSMIGYAQDVTERKRSAEEEFRLQGQLLHAQKMEAIGHLAAGVAHDFNNILQSILGYAQLLQERIERDPVSTRYADAILFAVTRASDLTRGLLAFGRKQAMTFEPVDLNELLRDTGRLLERILGGEIELTMMLSEQPLIVSADATHLQQSLVALATHARESMPGGGRIFVSTNPVDLNGAACLAHDTGSAGRHALLSVSDIGAGIDEQDCARIFEPFYAGGAGDRGRGIGLAAVYGVVKQHGGFIDVSSEPGSGTTFRIYMPLRSSDEPPAAAAERSVVQPGQGIVLLAEDDPQVRSLMKDLISSLGYGVLLAADGVEAVSLFGQYKATIDVILLDIAMPKMSGRDAAEQIRRLSPSAKVLFMSAYAEETPEIRRLMGEGAAFLSKPVSVQQLSEQIKRVLGR